LSQFGDTRVPRRASVSGSRRDARRRDILVAAAGVLAVREAAGMAEVATASAIARGKLYRYFPTRESLLQALEPAASGEAGAPLVPHRSPSGGGLTAPVKQRVARRYRRRGLAPCWRA